MGFFNDVSEYCYMQPEIPQKYKTEVIKLVGYEGNPDEVQLIAHAKVKMGGIPFHFAMLVTRDMVYFKDPLSDSFTLKLYSNTAISHEKGHIFFNGQKVYVTDENGDKITDFLKNLISTLPASDNGILGKFERIACTRMYCRGQIPEAKLRNALDEDKDTINPPTADDVIMLIDDTLTEDADNHLLITKDMLYINRMLKRPIQRRLYSTTNVSYSKEDGKSSLCKLKINDVPVCTIHNEDSAKLLVSTMQEMLKDCPAGDASYMGIFEQIIHQEISVKPYIPAKFISNALTNFKLDIPADEILVLVDDTLADSFKNGLILTKNCLYVKAFLNDTYAIELSPETDVKFDEKNQIVVNGKPIFEFVGSDLLGPQTFVRGLQCLISTLDSQNSSKSALEQKISQIVHKQFHKAPHIPKDILSNAIAKYAPDVKPEDVLCLFDISLMGSGKEGLLLTKDTLYAKTMIMSFKASSNVKSLKDVFSPHTTKKVTISPNDEIASKGGNILVNNEVVCSFIMDDKEIVPQLVEVLNLMKTSL